MVAGASMGGCIAIAFAASYSEKLDGLGLVDTTAWYGATAPQDWEDRARKSLDEGLKSLVGLRSGNALDSATEFREAHPDILNEVMAVFLANDIPAYAETCRMLGRCDKRAALPSIKVPTCIMVGEEDYATPIAMAQATHAAIPHSTLAVIPGVRHLTPLECPDIVQSALRGIIVPHDRDMNDIIPLAKKLRDQPQRSFGNRSRRSASPFAVMKTSG